MDSKFQFLQVQPSGVVGITKMHRVKVRIAGGGTSYDNFVVVDLTEEAYSKLMALTRTVAAVTHEEQCLDHLFGPPYQEAI